MDRSMQATSGWRKHGPFLLLLAVLFLVAYWMESQIAELLPALHAARILIQLALAATVIAILRNVVGIKAFGTFAPVIIAFSMIYTGLVLGLLLFGVVMLIMILTRGALQGQRIQQSHRAAILVLMVALVAILISAYAASLGLPDVAFVLLFPVVITAWVADLYLVKVGKVGWAQPTTALLWTLILVAAAYLVIIQDWLVDLIMREPLSWPLLVMLNWALGTRVKIRLSDRLRFGALRRMEDVMLRGGVSRTVLTIKRRNRNYVDKYNPSAVMGRLNKGRAKALLLGEGIPVPENYALITGKGAMDQAVEVFHGASSFVIKPASGYGGEGIVVVHRREGKRFFTSKGVLKAEDLMAHLRTILEGTYNHDEPDEALVEALVVTPEMLRPLAPEGVPDVRVLCLLGYPVMAMLRLPTVASEGKANLHLGAVGAGVELATGNLSFATWRGEIVRRHPDTGAKLVGFQVPHWSKILEMASEAQKISGLGFAGVDVVLDRERGPLVLEVNRRPGLEIQKANGAGLLPRLEVVESWPLRNESPAVRVLRAMEADRFGWVPAPEKAPGTRRGPGPELPPDELSVSVAGVLNR